MIRYLVEKENIAHNVRLLRQRMATGKLYAVLKANGYGLGCREMAILCAENGVDHFAVSDLADAEAVVASGVRVQELLFLSSAPKEQIPRLVQLGVTFTVASESDATRLSDYWVNAHIKVDTGMGRRGFLDQAPDRIAALYEAYPNIRFTGIYTHFADGSNRKGVTAQFARFEAVLNYLQKQGISVGLRHCCSSGSVFLEDAMLLDGARVGSALLGRIVGGQAYGLRPTGVCAVPIEAVRTIPKGATVSYGRTFRAKKEMRVAICPVGTHHGLGLVPLCGRQSFWPALLENLRRLRNRMLGRSVPYAMIAGQKCECLGCICSEMVVLDVTDIHCQAGDTALFNINPILLSNVPIEWI